MATWLTDDYEEITTDLTTYTFTAMDIGTAVATRVAVALLYWRDTASNDIDNVTIGGVAATQMLKLAFDSGGGGGSTSGLAVYAAVVPSGTTADVVMELSTGAIRAACRLRTADDISLTAHDTLEASGADPLVGVINLAEDGLICAAMANNDTTSTVAWTGVTELFEEIIEAGSMWSGAYHDAGTEEANRPVEADFTGTAGDHLMIAVSFALNVVGGSSIPVKMFAYRRRRV